MSGRLARASAALGALLLAGSLAACTAEQGGAGESQPEALPAPLPAVELASFDGGEPLDLGGLRGPAVVNLWASWCGPCRREMPLLEEFSQEYAGRVDVIGVDYQDAREGEARELVEETGVTYPLYADPQGALDRAGPFPHLRGLPFMAFVDADGQVVEWQFVEVRSVGQLEELVAEHLGVA